MATSPISDLASGEASLRVRFGAFELDEADARLTRDGQAIALPPRPFAPMLGHMYLGSIGMQGAYHTMRYDGLVDEQWAKEHHEYWYDEVMARRQENSAGSVLQASAAQPSMPA